MHRVPLVAALCLLAGGCLPPQLAMPEPGLARIPIERRVTSCRGEYCTFDVRVGGTRYRVRSDARTVTPGEAVGGAKPSLASRAAGGVGKALLRSFGLTTTSRGVLLDTRTVADSASAMQIRCTLLTIADVETERVGTGQEETTIERARGADCVATAADDTVPRWRYRAGIAPMTDSLAMVLGTLDPFGSVQVDRAEPRLVRHVASSDEPVRYTILETGPDGWMPQARSIVRRADGTLVGMIVRLDGDPVAIDVAPGADAEESALLRMLGVIFVRR